MNEFSAFLKRHNININDVKNSSEHSTYVKWRQGKHTDPRNSSMRIFLETFGEKFNHNFMELSNCFDGNEREEDDFIITITSELLPRRTLSVLEELAKTRYVDKRILLINATPYGDLVEAFGIDSEDTIELMSFDVNHIQKPEQLRSYIHKTKYQHVDMLHLTHVYNSSPFLLPEDEEDIAKSFRQSIADLEEYDNILIGCSMGATYVKRILGAVANVCIVFSDAYPVEDRGHLMRYHTIREFNNKFIILDVPDAGKNLRCNHNEGYLKNVGNLFEKCICKELG